jgi:hypothetical protein
MQNERGQSDAAKQNGQSPSFTCGNSRITQYLKELNHVCKEGHDTTNDHVARLAAALIARAPAELARLLEVRA